MNQVDLGGYLVLCFFVFIVLLLIVISPPVKTKNKNNSLTKDNIKNKDSLEYIEKKKVEINLVESNKKKSDIKPKKSSNKNQKSKLENKNKIDDNKTLNNDFLKSYHDNYDEIDCELVFKMLLQINNKKNQINENMDSPESLGAKGELEIFEVLKDLESFPLFLFNLYLPTKNKDKFSEIDVIMIHYSGIYIFESKNLKGWIFGNENNRFWTQVLCYRQGKQSTKQKNRFFNPILQNKIHIRNFKRYSKNRPIPFYNYVIFSDKAKFKDVTIENDDVNLLTIKELKEVIINKNYFNEKNLTKEQVCKIFNILYPLTIKSKEFREKHVNKIRKNKKEA